MTKGPEKFILCDIFHIRNVKKISADHSAHYNKILIISEIQSITVTLYCLPISSLILQVATFQKYSSPEF
jgi:hypothetical protein